MVRRQLILIVSALLLSSCSPAPRDILVQWREGRLVIDFPWSIWRLIGLQDRVYCIQRVDLFADRRIIWTMTMQTENRSCLDVRMPLPIGAVPKGFIAQGNSRISGGRRFGLAVDGIGDGRVDFIVEAGGRVINFTDWEEQVERPPRFGK